MSQDEAARGSSVPVAGPAGLAGRAASYGARWGGLLALVFSVASSVLSLFSSPRPETSLLVIFVMFASVCGALVGTVSALAAVGAARLSSLTGRPPPRSAFAAGAVVGASLSWLLVSRLAYWLQPVWVFLLVAAVAVLGAWLAQPRLLRPS